MQTCRGMKKESRKNEDEQQPMKKNESKRWERREEKTGTP